MGAARSHCHHQNAALLSLKGPNEVLLPCDRAPGTSSGRHTNNTLWVSTQSTWKPGLTLCFIGEPAFVFVVDVRILAANLVDCLHNLWERACVQKSRIPSGRTGRDGKKVLKGAAIRFVSTSLMAR